MTPVLRFARWAAPARHPLALALVVGAALWGAPGVVQAESALLLPARGDDELQTLRALGQGALRKALEDQGIRVISREQAVTRLPDEEGRDCIAVDCAPPLLRAASADFAVAMAIWASGGSGGSRSVFVTLINAHGTRYPGSAVLTGDQVVAAVQQALVDARGLQLLGPGPWLRVAGTPEGAEVHLDGAVVGSMPFRAAVTAGPHTLEVRAEGHAPLIQSMDVPPNASRQLEVAVQLEPRASDWSPLAAGDASAADDGATETRTERPLWGPLLLGVAGVGVLAASVVVAAKDDCVDVQGRCLDGQDKNTGAIVAWGALGGGAIAGAILWRVLGVREVEGAPSVSLSPRGVAMRQRF